MNKYVLDLHCDIAPAEGRTGLDQWQADSPTGQLNWDDSDFTLGVKMAGHPTGRELNISLEGEWHPRPGLNLSAGWIELETSPQPEPVITDLYLVGSRPLPRPDINCICRHPLNNNYLIAGTEEAKLLVLDARLPANLQVLAELSLPAPLASLVCCGKYLLGLELPSGQNLQIIALANSGQPMPGHLLSRMDLPIPLSALAENDALSAWGLTAAGEFYRLRLPSDLSAPNPAPLVEGDTMRKIGTLGRGRVLAADLTSHIKSLFRAIKDRNFSRRHFWPRPGPFVGFAFNGSHFWSFRQSGLNKNSVLLWLHDQQGPVMRAFTCWPEVAVSALNYIHNQLLILDSEHQQLHLYQVADSMQPIAALTTAKRHPGYCPAGTSLTGGIHDLCLLYVGAEGTNVIHRYDLEKLRPLVGYVNAEGIVQDHFMDGFLLLAQYSPLLNGCAFSSDLQGPPSRREDWLALFDEYFHPLANLHALEACAQEINGQLDKENPESIKVVLAIPAADGRCMDWNQAGSALPEDSNRIAITRWAMQELIDRWSVAGFRSISLAGFYHMSEQGAWNDPVQQLFPQMCHEHQVGSFAIPGLTSSWLTEFSRAGFDCIALQSSHAFWKPLGRTRYHALKYAGRIAREFGMGMEVEIPYNILDPAGEQKLRDYFRMARIQGWAGAFKAYFQSYNLIKTLAESSNPASRQLYDELYYFSRMSRQSEEETVYANHDATAVTGEYGWKEDSEVGCFQLNIEGYRGRFALTKMSAK